jgi:hypothetical protein
MSGKITKEQKISDAFLVLGSQYYTLARYSAEQFYYPVSITLFHHAIEMLMKGYLSLNRTSAQLKKVGHNLVDLWEQIKATSGDENLSRFDMTISSLNQVELLRYPDSIVEKGYALNVRIGTVIPMSLPGLEELPKYTVDVTQIDEISIEIFKLCARPVYAYFTDAPDELKVTLPHQFKELE